METVPQEVKSRMEELEKENFDLRKSVALMKEQIEVIRKMYSNDDYEDGKKIKKVEMEIKELKDERKKMMAIIEEMRMEKKKTEQPAKREGGRE